MAVKPLTQPEYWATDAVYSTGPFIGQPQKVIPPGAFAAEGHRPGALFPTPAEFENSQQYNLTGLARWVFLGSSAGAADAHIVETDGTGRATLHGLTVTNTTTQTPVFATGNGVLAPVYRATNPNGGDGYVANLSGSTGSAFSSELEGNSKGLELTHDGSGTCIDVDASAGTGAVMVLVGNATVQAATITGGAGQAALSAVSGANALAAITANGAGTAFGVEALGGSGSSAGVGARGTATHADADGLHGRTSTSASTTAAGVRAEGRGAGTTGLFAVNQVGRAAVFQGDASSPAYAATRWVPQDDDPSAGTNDGEVFWHSDHRTLRTGIAGNGWRSMLTMGPGSALYQVAAQNFGVVQSVGNAFATLLSVSCLEAAGQGFFNGGSGGVFIAFSCEVRVPTAPRTIDIDLLVNGSSVATWSGSGTAANNGFDMVVPTSNWGQPPINIKFLHVPGAEGDLTVEIQVRSIGGGGANPEIRNAGLQIIGTFLVV